MKRDLLIPLVSIIILGAGGITSMVLGAVLELEWCKNIAFFIFGMSTSPLYDSAKLVRTGVKPPMQDSIKRLFIGGLFGAALSLTACGGDVAGYDPQCAIDVAQDCIEQMDKCKDTDSEETEQE